MRKLREKLKRPKRPWDSARIDEEKELLRKYGLRRKREIRRAYSELRKFRQRARNLIAISEKEKEKVLLTKLQKLGILEKEAKELDDVLALKIENLLDRRLQSIVFKKGLSKTISQARQHIVHGHVMINNKMVKFPSYMVSIEEEPMIASNMKK